MSRELDLTLSEDWDDLGYRIDFGRSISLGKGTLWSARISKRRLTKAGNEGKADHVITLVHEDDPIELLRQVAELFNEGLNGPVVLAGGETAS